MRKSLTRSRRRRTRLTKRGRRSINHRKCRAGTARRRREISDSVNEREKRRSFPIGDRTHADGADGADSLTKRPEICQARGRLPRPRPSASALKEQWRSGIGNGASSHKRQEPLQNRLIVRGGVKVALRNWTWQNGERCYARKGGGKEDGREEGQRAGTHAVRQTARQAGRRAGRPEGRKEGRRGEERGKERRGALSISPASYFSIVRKSKT